MNNDAKQETTDIRYDSAGKKFSAPSRNKEVENAVLAINDKLDQLLGILSSTLPTRIGTELKEAVGTTGSSGMDSNKIVEILSKDLPDRIKADADENVFQKAEMLSMVISTSFQHLQDTFRSYQESILKALEALAEAQQKTGDVLIKIENALSAGAIPTETNKPSPPPPPPPSEEPSKLPSPFSTATPTSPSSTQPSPDGTPPPESEPKPFEQSPPSTPDPTQNSKTDSSDNNLPGWLQADRDDNQPSTPNNPSGI